MTARYGPRLRTIARNRGKLIHAILAGAVGAESVRCCALETGFSARNVDAAFRGTLEQQILSGHAKLIAYLDRPQNTPAGLHRYCAKVHSNLWYYVDSTTAPDGSGPPLPSREPGEPLTHHTDAPATGGDWHKVACGITHARAGSITSGFDGTTCPDCRKALGLPEIP